MPSFFDKAHNVILGVEDGVDSLYLSPFRNGQSDNYAFFGKVFSPDSVTENRAALGMAATAGVVLTVMQEIKECIESHQKSDDYVKQVVASIDQKSKGFKDSFYNQVALQALSDEIANGVYEIEIIDNVISVKLRKEIEKASEAEKQAQREARIANLKLSKYEQLFERITSTKAYAVVEFAWVSVSLSIAMTFWVISFIVGNPAAFGKNFDNLSKPLQYLIKYALPLVEPVIFIGSKLLSYIFSKFNKNKQPKTNTVDSSNQCEAHKQQLISTRLLELHYRNLGNGLEDVPDTVNAVVEKDLVAYIEKNRAKKKPNYIKRQLGEKLGYSRFARILSSAIRSFLNNYVISFFSCVPILTGLIDFCGPAVVAALTSNWPIIVIWGISTISAIVGSIIGGTRENIQAKENSYDATQAAKKDVVAKLVAAKLRNKRLRQLANVHYQYFVNKADAYAVANLKSQALEARIDQQDQTVRRTKLLPNAGRKAVVLNAIYNVCDQLLKIKLMFPIWTASFFNRSFFAKGMLLQSVGAIVGVTSALLPHALPIGLLVFGVFFVGNFLINRFMKNCQARDKERIAEMEANLKVFEGENGYLQKLVVTQKVYCNQKYGKKSDKSKNTSPVPANRPIYSNDPSQSQVAVSAKPQPSSGFFDQQRPVLSRNGYELLPNKNRVTLNASGR